MRPTSSVGRRIPAAGSDVRPAISANREPLRRACAQRLETFAGGVEVVELEEFRPDQPAAREKHELREDRFERAPADLRPEGADDGEVAVGIRDDGVQALDERVRGPVEQGGKPGDVPLTALDPTGTS